MKQFNIEEFEGFDESMFLSFLDSDDNTYELLIKKNLLFSFQKVL